MQKEGIAYVKVLDRAGQNLTRSRNRKKVLGWCEMDGAAVREWIREEAGGRSCRARE